MLFSSHLLSEVQQLCSRVIILHEGRMIRSLELGAEESGTIRLRLRVAGQKDAAVNALKALDCVEQAEAGASAEEGETEILAVCRRADEKGRATDQVFRVLAKMNMPIREMREEKDSLEEVFLRETEN